MPGLLSGGSDGTTKLNDVRRDTGTATPAPAPAPGQEQQPGADGQRQASPEEQQEYDEFVDNALKVIYDEKTLPSVLKALEGDGDPIEGLAQATAMVVMRVEDSAESAGRDLSMPVLFNGGEEILRDLANLSKTKGIHEFNDQDLEKAVFRVMDIYKAARGGQEGAQTADQEPQSGGGAALPPGQGVQAPPGASGGLLRQGA